jgi:hypothetical protein
VRQGVEAYMRDGREKIEKGGDGGCFVLGVLGMGRIRLGFMNIYGLLVGCRATSGWPKIRVGLVPGHHAEGAAQARSDHRAEPVRGTIPFVPCRARAGLFRVVPVPAHRVWPIWPSIAQGCGGG